MFRKLNDILGIKKTKVELEKVDTRLNLSAGQFKYYIENDLLPTLSELEKIEEHFGITPNELKIQLGKSDMRLKRSLAGVDLKIKVESGLLLRHETTYGKLFQGDCISLLRQQPDNSVDLIFADPPFNLSKEYKSNMDDDLTQIEYLSWCETWLDECIRVLKYGGSLFVWNLPKWNTHISSFLNDRLIFKNWIATDIKYSLPIAGRLYPSHYSLLYYTKGIRPKVFKPDRLPMETCRKCFSEIKDYGGYKNKMNKKGINISDVWTDIPPVRHKSHKRREANELSIKLLDRIIEMASIEGDLVFDPFGGSGTTYSVAELKMRKWIGVELGPVDEIIERLNNIDQDSELLNKYRMNLNVLFPDAVKKRRKERGIWTDDTFKDESEQNKEKKRQVSLGS